MGKYLAIYDDDLYELCSKGAKEKNTTKSKYAKALLREAFDIKNSKDGTKNEVSNEGSGLSDSDRSMLKEALTLQNELIRKCSGTVSNLNQRTKAMNTIAKNNNVPMNDTEIRELVKDTLTEVIAVKEMYVSIKEELKIYNQKMQR